MSDELDKPKEVTPKAEPTNDELLSKISENPAETLKELLKKRTDAQKSEQIIKDLNAKIEQATAKETAKAKSDAEAKDKKKQANGEFETLLKESQTKLTEFEKNLADSNAKLGVFEARELAKKEKVLSELKVEYPELSETFTIDNTIEQLEAVLNVAKVKKQGFTGVPPPNTSGAAEVKLDITGLSPHKALMAQIQNMD